MNHTMEDGTKMSNDEAMENMMLSLRAIKQVKIRQDTQLMLLDMAGVPELVEQMIAENPEMLEENMDFNPSEDPEFQEFMKGRGFGLIWKPGPEFGQWMADSDASLGKVMKAVGIAK